MQNGARFYTIKIALATQIQSHDGKKAGFPRVFFATIQAPPYLWQQAGGAHENQPEAQNVERG